MAEQKGVTPDRSGTVEGNGKTIFWEYHGDGSKEVVCLLNGLAMHTRAWYPFLDEVRPDYDVLLYDYPGQGQSSSEDLPCTIPELASYLETIVDQEGIAKLHVMGISYGGFVALDFARLYQERLHTLTLSGILLEREQLFQMYQDLSLLFYRSGPKAFEIYTHYLYEKIFGERAVRRFWDHLEDMRTRFYDRYHERVHALIQLTLAQDPFFANSDANLDEYRAITTPALVLAGAEDRTIPPRVQRKIAGILPQARYEEIEESGHVVYLEQPEIFFPMIRSFMASKSIDF